MFYNKIRILFLTSAENVDFSLFSVHSSTPKWTPGYALSWKKLTLLIYETIIDLRLPDLNCSQPLYAASEEWVDQRSPNRRSGGWANPLYITANARYQTLQGPKNYPRKSPSKRFDQLTKRYRNRHKPPTIGCDGQTKNLKSPKKAFIFVHVMNGSGAPFFEPRTVWRLANQTYVMWWRSELNGPLPDRTHRYGGTDLVKTAISRPP